MSWFYGSGGDAGIRQTISNSMNFCVDTYNSHGYIHAYQSNGAWVLPVPTTNGPQKFYRLQFP